MKLPRPDSPAARGFRWPAEWEPHHATWLSWPHNRETWPEHLAEVERAFAAIVAALVPHELVCIGVRDASMEDSVRKILRETGSDPDRGVEFHHYPTNDAWARDHGPVFVAGQELAVVDFRFDNWGRKYPDWEPDDAVPERVAAIRGLERFACDVVIEGGGIDGDGAGSVLTTESCLLNPNRGPGRSRERMEQVLADHLGATRVLWLAAGIAGDDTDGHVDDVARFVAPGAVVAAVCDDTRDPNHTPLAENRRRLADLRDARGAALDVVELPMPPRLEHDGGPLPASYANFYLANGVALVPTFQVASDRRALAILGELLPGRDIVGIPCRELVSGFGAIHCVTQQEPAAGVTRGAPGARIR